MKADAPCLGAVLQSFFTDYLRAQKGLRPNSIKSYADAIRLWLQFAAEASGKKVTQLVLDDFDADAVSGFLTWLEEHRDNAPQTRNQRLAAVRAFFEYVGRRFPERLRQAQRITAIPRKRATSPETVFLERDEIERVLAGLRTGSRSPLRDRTLLLFLYNTGARVQEVADLRVTDVELDPSPRVHLHGKGDKWRVCPLWAETAGLLKDLLSHSAPSGAPDQPVFTGPKGTALTRYGIYKMVRRYTTTIVKTGSDGRRRWVSPHTWRHSTAVHLLEAGVEVNVIRAWLGHVSLETTNRYAEITLRTKQAALETCAVPAFPEERIPRKAVWESDTALLSWLQSL
jgi:integrase/recombinase XerD